MHLSAIAPSTSFNRRFGHRHQGLVFELGIPIILPQRTRLHKKVYIACNANGEADRFRLFSMCKVPAIRHIFVAFFAVTQLSVPVSEWSWGIQAADAVLYSPNAQIPRNPDVALRRAIPAVNSATKQMQESLEEILYLLRIPQRKPYNTMESNVKKALKLANDGKDAIIMSIPEDQRDRGLQLYNDLVNGKGGLLGLLDTISQKDPDKVSVKLASSLDTLSQLELLQAPGLPYLLPSQYQQYPRLTGRAVVEFIVEKGDGSGFTVAAGQGPQKFATIQVVLDGYSAPITAGNFAEKVVEGVYNGMKLRGTDQAILSDNEASKSDGNLPLEIMPSGEFQPLYKTTLSIQDGELPILPLSVYGAVAMAHDSTEEDYSSADQFFFYLYDRRNAGLGGLSFDEGQFSVFGYVTDGREILPQLKTGDIIQSAKVVSGLNNLVIPSGIALSNSSS